MIEKLDAGGLERDLAADSLEEREKTRLPAGAPGAAAAEEGLAAEGWVEEGLEEKPAAESLIPLQPGELRGAVEALLFSSPDPIQIRLLSDVLAVPVHDVRAAVEDLRLEYIDQGRAFRIEDIAGGVQMLTVSKFDPWIRAFHEKERQSKLSGAALETLSVIAYKQPIGKADLEAIRGVGCSPILKTLLDRGLVQVVGRGEGLGRPLLYGTTRRFLESFGLGSIRDLPQPELTERPQEAEAAPRPPSLAPAASPRLEERGERPSAEGEGEDIVPERGESLLPGGPLS